ncbi:MAG: FkbM family methyltransferase [Acidobacteriaceae bacterium]|nr:FkbM family methyltransferase [Acidobacteriaceae bacterium]
MIRRLASLLPDTLQEELRRFRFLSRARSGRFSPNEPESDILERFVSLGDWVIDVGANVGQYTLLLSKLVGPAGRVLAFEPMTTTVATLASVAARYSAYHNVSVLNMAASDHSGILSFELPIDQSGLRNYERAQVSQNGKTPVFGIPIDALQLTKRLSLAKIDAEGHEPQVLNGMRHTIERDLPVLIVEDNCELLPDFLYRLGYVSEKLRSDSPNVILSITGTSRNDDFAAGTSVSNGIALA